MVDYNVNGLDAINTAFATNLQMEMHEIHDTIFNGVNYNSTLLAATSTGSALERWHIPMTAINYTAAAWLANEQQTKLIFMKAVILNFNMLTAAGMAQGEAGVVSVMRATAIARAEFPSTAALAGVPVLDASFLGVAQTIQESRDPYMAIARQAMTIYPTMKLISNDYVNYLHLAHLFRKTEIHLTSTTASYIRKFNAISLAVRGSSGNPQSMLMTIAMFRAFGHAWGFLGLVGPCQASLAMTASVFQQRANVICAGSGLVPTTSAALDALMSSMVAVPANMAAFAQRLQAATIVIRTAPLTYAVHYRFYNPLQVLQAQQPEYALAKQLSPMLAGWIRSLSNTSTLKSQKVISRGGDSNPEDVELWERLFIAHRRGITQTANVSDALVTLVGSLV